MELLTKLLDEFKCSAKRIETFPVYKIKDEWEEYERYINGIPEFQFEKNNWQVKIENTVKNKGTIERIRVIPKQINSYLTFEAETGYVPNSIVGEKIFVISQSQYKKLVPFELQGDFWIFDDSIVLKMNYDKNGEFIGSEIVTDEEFRKKIILLFKKMIPHTKELEYLLKIIRTKNTIYYE